MNGLKYICLACIIPFLPSCMQEEHTGDAGDDGRVTVSLTFSTRTEEGADEGMESDEGNNENLIRTVRVYVFDGSDGSLTGYHHADLSGENVTEKSFNIRLGFSRHTIPSDGHTCLFYAIANEGSAEGLKSLPAAVYNSETGRYVWTDDKGITQQELLGLTFSGLPESKLTEGDLAAKDETGKKYSSPNLPMAVKQEVVITKETENLTLPLRRSVGKMELYFAKGGIGEGDLYIGRGVYLYNIPTKGYLFPKDNLTLKSDEIAHRESNEGYTSDSPYQKNGLPILRCGFAGTPSNPDEIAQLHINRIIRRWNNKAPDDNTDGRKEYQWLPGKAVYLFANPYESDKNATSGVEGDGYYMKILHHSHENSDTGADKEESHMDYVTLPAVNPNMFVKVFLVIPLDGYTATRTWWKVGDWTEVNIPDISFD